MFFNFFLKSFRILLLPFALLYWLGIGIRNWLYDKNIFKSASFGLPLICVGNLSVGGTGKSPMVEYLVSKLKGKFNLATLSRGYKRKTKGYALANQYNRANGSKRIRKDLRKKLKNINGLRRNTKV